MKKWVTEYLSVSRKERSGFVVLLIIVCSIWLLPRYFGKRNVNSSLLVKADAALASARTESVSVVKPARLFAFDPNTLTDDGWKELGLSEKNVRTIRNYLNKGGKFRKAADIHRIYGIRSELAGQLEPYVRIRDEHSHAFKWRHAPPIRYPDKMPAERSAGAFRPRKTQEIIDINEADTSALIALPGIGSKLAARIILFREKCGGFHNVQQVAEVYGLKDSVFQIIRPMMEIKGPALRMLRINSVGADSLAMHPYITHSEAKAIVKYRQQHGAFQHAEDLLRIAIIHAEWVEKIKPYLEFN